jgi:hypothetical protein
VHSADGFPVDNRDKPEFGGLWGSAAAGPPLVVGQGHFVLQKVGPLWTVRMRLGRGKAREDRPCTSRTR